MRSLIVLAGLGLGTAMPAFGQAVDDGDLKTNFDSCIDSCGEAHGFGFCARTCGCMVYEMGRRWDSAAFQERMDRLSADDGDVEIDAEMTRLAEYCAYGEVRTPN